MSTQAVLIPGTYNSRDLGGVMADGGSVRRRTMLRSDAAVALGAAGRAALQDLGVRTAIDLREPVERRLDPPDLDGTDIVVRHQPIIGESFKLAKRMTLEEIYSHILEFRGENLTAALRVLAERGAMPAIVFCSAGKDRTGLISALLLDALGVSDEDIVADYARTEQNMHGEFREKLIRRAMQAGITEQGMAVRVGAPPLLMRESLAWVREHHGDTASYLRAHGMTDAELSALRHELVEPSQAKAA